MTPCIFCQIIAGKIPSKKVYEDEKTLAFHDVNPLAPIHVLLIPKQHIKSLADATNSDLLGHIQVKAKEIAQKLGIKNAFRLTTASGKDAGQTVFHLHYHLLGGWPGGISQWKKAKKLSI